MLKGARYADKSVISGVKKAAKKDVVIEIAKQPAQKGAEIGASAISFIHSL